MQIYMTHRDREMNCRLTKGKGWLSTAGVGWLVSHLELSLTTVRSVEATLRSASEQHLPNAELQIYRLISL